MDNTINEVTQFLRTKNKTTPDLSHQFVPSNTYKIKPLKIKKYNDNQIELLNDKLKKKLDIRLQKLQEQYVSINDIKKKFIFDTTKHLKGPSLKNLEERLNQIHTEYLSILENLLNNISIGNSHYTPLFSNNLNQSQFKLKSFKEVQFQTSQSTCPKLSFDTNTSDRNVTIDKSLSLINDLINEIKIYDYKHLMTGGSQKLEDIFYYFYGSPILNSIYELLELIIKFLISKNYFYKSQLVSYKNFKLIPKQYFDVLLKEQVIFYREILQHYLNNVKDNSLLLHWYSFIILLNLCNHILTLPNLISIKNDGKYINLLLLNKELLDNYYITKMMNISKPLNMNGVSLYTGYKIGMLSYRYNSFTIFITGIETNTVFNTIFGTSDCNGFITNILEELNLSYSYTYFSLFNNNREFTPLSLTEFHSLKTLIDFNNIFTILIKHTFILTIVFIPKNYNMQITQPTIEPITKLVSEPIPSSIPKSVSSPTINLQKQPSKKKSLVLPIESHTQSTNRSSASVTQTPRVSAANSPIRKSQEPRVIQVAPASTREPEKTQVPATMSPIRKSQEPRVIQVAPSRNPIVTEETKKIQDPTTQKRKSSQTSLPIRGGAKNTITIQPLIQQEPFKTLIENKKFYIILNI